MRAAFRFAVLLLLAASTQAQEIRYQGIKPAVVIDVRTAEEFATGHIAGAINLPYEQIGKTIQTVKGLKKDSPILLYCRSGRRSAIARNTLTQQGYRQILDGGSMDTLARQLQSCTANC